MTEDERKAATTWAWQCMNCGQTSYTSQAGGSLDPCECPNGMNDGNAIRVFTLFGGKRTDLGTPLEIEARARGATRAVAFAR